MRFWVLGFRFRDSGLGIGDSGFGIQVSGFGIRVSVFGIRDSGFGFRISVLPAPRYTRTHSEMKSVGAEKSIPAALNASSS